MSEHKSRFTNFIHNYRTMMIAAIIAAVFWFPVGYFHELGHVIVCASNGYQFTVFHSGLDLVTDCSDLPKPTWLYWSLGGIFGVIISAVPILVKKIRKSRGLFLGVLLLTTAQAINGISETFLHSLYMGPNSHQILAIIGTPIFLILILKLGLPKKTK